MTYFGTGKYWFLRNVVWWTFGVESKGSILGKHSFASHTKQAREIKEKLFSHLLIVRTF